MFRTEIQIHPAGFSIDRGMKLLSIGSCFATNIGSKLQELKYDISVNPAGIAYNPISLADFINSPQFDSKLSLQQEGRWVNYGFHSSLNASSEEELVRIINSAVEELNSAAQADVVIITLGTAFAYRLKENGAIVANCHKTPSNQFDRILLDPMDILERFETIAERSKSRQFIFTVSPVRHTRDGLANNSMSKSILRFVCGELEKKHSNCTYFPAFEIMMDDLRDYRFYSEDMIHPTSQATDYIFDKFSAFAFSETEIELNNKIQKLLRAVNHRPFNQDSDAHLGFIRETIDRMKGLKDKVDFSQEIEILKSGIIQQ